VGRLSGMETVAFCEFDKKAQLVLKKHWPDVPIFDDVRELNGEQLKHLYNRPYLRRIPMPAI
jgi:site-specific DNA-cytosine methylase